MTTYEMQQIAKMQAQYLAEALKSDPELLDMMFPPKFMGIDEASVFIGIPVNTIYAKIGEIPHKKVGKRLIFTDRGLTRWINTKETEVVEVELKSAIRKVM
jgi:hypothetical protein